MYFRPGHFHFHLGLSVWAGFLKICEILVRKDFGDHVHLDSRNFCLFVLVMCEYCICTIIFTVCYHFGINSFNDKRNFSVVFPLNTAKTVATRNDTIIECSQQLQTINTKETNNKNLAVQEILKSYIHSSMCWRW